MKALIYGARSAAKVAACACPGIAAAIVINPPLLLPLVALGAAAGTVGFLCQENKELRAKLADERDRAAKLRRACSEALRVLLEGGAANFLAAALMTGTPPGGRRCS